MTYNTHRVVFDANGERCPKSYRQMARRVECGVYDRTQQPFIPHTKPPGPRPTPPGPKPTPPGPKPTPAPPWIPPTPTPLPTTNGTDNENPLLIGSVAGLAGASAFAGVYGARRALASTPPVEVLSVTKWLVKGSSKYPFAWIRALTISS